jgi:hypothetical protein
MAPLQISHREDDAVSLGISIVLLLAGSLDVTFASAEANASATIQT